MAWLKHAGFGAAVVGLLLWSSLAVPARADDGPALTNADVADATRNFMAWTEAFRSGDYETQWHLTDLRIRHWRDIRRWRQSMENARRTGGALAHYRIQTKAPIAAEKLPCTEHGHCYRRHVPYVVFILRTKYDKAAPGQPEYAVMAKSDEGWRFGGGTFPNRPLGETAVILTEADELRYKQDLSILR